MTPESIPKNTPDSQEKPKAVEPGSLESKPEDTIEDRIKNFSKLSVEEKAEEIDNALKDSVGLASAYQDIELEVAGGKDKLEGQVKLGWADWIKTKFAGAESARGQEIKFRKIAEIAHREVEKKLGVIGQTDGQQLKDRKAALTVHEKNSNDDLRNLEGLGVHSKEEIAGIKTKLVNERAELTQDVEARKNELESKLAEFSQPAVEKKEQLDACAVEYKGYLDNVTQEIRTVGGNIAKHERGLASLKLEGATAKEYKDKIRQAIDEQKGKLAKLEAGKTALEQRLAAVKANKSQVDAYLERIENIGKTPEEIRQRKAEERKKQEEKAENRKSASDIPDINARAGTGGGAANREGASEETSESEEEKLWDEYEEAKRKERAQSKNVSASQIRGGRFKPSQQPRVNAPETAPTPEATMSGQPEVRTETDAEEKKVIQIGKLFNKLHLSELTGEELKAAQNCFKLKKEGEFEPTASMTAGQFAKAYRFYLTDQLEYKHKPDKTNFEVAKKVKEFYHTK